ncbi:trypsin-like peptidase domain-containing protein [Nonomuraea sp. PA05]|uniref:VMAP-C domain-containing protein n=1 Tax=Nonomuraea sp. PA05 TaxID=2604466 RepID=UPI0011DBFB7C|nr:trypsin-like peptidase domain-containing protein [Nonomuraea sp. PA05]TYB61753.1 trypsin-like peptidase domain-containing protein [Nonomuraea sp. PA05]
MLDPCVVAIGAHDGGALCGSGFLLSPEHVVTCAHVLAAAGAAAKGELVDVVWPDESITGEVLEVLPPEWGDDAVYDMPDLAVVKISGGARACVWMGFGGLSSGDEPEIATYSHGYLLNRFARGRLGSLYFTKVSLVSGTEDEDLRLATMEIAEGCSGSPMDAPGAHAVIGVVKAAKDGGSMAVRLSDLMGLRPELYRDIWRKNIRYHVTHRHWITHRVKQLGERIEYEARLLELLAELPRPENPEKLLGSTRPELAAPERRMPPRVRDYWDIAHHVFAETGDLDRLHPVLGLIVRVLPPAARDVRSRLMACGEQWAKFLGQERLWAAALEAAVSEVSAVAVKVVHGQQSRQAGPPLYRYVVRESEPHQPPYSTPLSRDELEDGLKRDLRAPLRRLGRSRHDPAIYLNLPGDLLSLDVEEWAGLMEHDPGMTLGSRFPIIVRDHSAAENHGDSLDARWKVLENAAPPLPLLPVDCGHELAGYTDRQRRGWFLGNAGERAGLMFSCDHDLLLLAARYGVPVVLWWRAPCPAPANRCTGSDRMTELAGELARTPLMELPKKVKELRDQALISGDGHCGAGLVLLFDDLSAADHLRFDDEPYTTL